MTGSKKKLADSLTYSSRLSLVNLDEDTICKSRQAKLLSLSRSSLYYDRTIPADDLKIMHKIDEIYTEHPYYGSRRISAALKRCGYTVGRKKARTYMNTMGIRAWYPTPNTSKSNKQHSTYPYLLRGYKVTKANEVWSTDITYIRMPKGWMYLVAIIDRYSRKILARRLSPTMDVSFCIECLKDALEHYGSPKIFNTDQGSQFTSNEFVGVLLDHKVQVSMDGKGRATDNAPIERFWRSAKQEEVYHQEYDTPMDVQLSIKSYIMKYNSSRLHSAIGYKTPDEVYESGNGLIHYVHIHC